MEKYDFGKKEDEYPPVNELDDKYINSVCDVLYKKTDCKEWKIKGIIFLEKRSLIILNIICITNNKSYILKHIKNTPRKSYTDEKFYSEVFLQNKAAKHDLAPKIEYAWKCGNNYYIIMEPMEKSLSYLLDTYKDFEVRKLILKESLELTSKLISIGIFHDDLHIQNIMVNYKNPKYKDLCCVKNEMELYKLYNYKYKAIDYGESQNLPNEIYDAYNEIMITDKKEVLKYIFKREILGFIFPYLLDEYNDL